MNYKLKENSGATGLLKGSVYTEKEINDLPGMGGVKRLTELGAIEETSDRATSESGPGDDPRAAHNNTGSPPALSEEEGKAEEARQQRMGSAQRGDAADKATPATGGPGDVQRVTGKRGPVAR